MNILGGVSLTINQESGKLDTQVFAEQVSLIFDMSEHYARGGDDC